MEVFSLFFAQKNEFVDKTNSFFSFVPIFYRNSNVIQILIFNFLQLIYLSKKMIDWSKGIVKKKNIIIFSVIIVVLLIVSMLFYGFYLLFNASLNEDKSKFFSSSEEIASEFGNTTYQFSGASEHYYFRYGMVYYDDNYQKIYIGGFQQKKEIENLKQVTFIVYLNNKKVWETSIDEKSNQLNKDIDIVGFYEAGPKCLTGDGCIITEFNKTTAETLPENLRIVINYCADQECIEENMIINYDIN